MRSWLLRGLILAFAMVVVRIVQGSLINTWETRASMISLVLLAIYAISMIVAPRADDPTIVPLEVRAE